MMYPWIVKKSYLLGRETAVFCPAPMSSLRKLDFEIAASIGSLQYIWDTNILRGFSKGKLTRTVPEAIAFHT